MTFGFFDPILRTDPVRPSGVCATAVDASASPEAVRAPAWDDFRAPRLRGVSRALAPRGPAGRAVFPQRHAHAGAARPSIQVRARDESPRALTPAYRTPGRPGHDLAPRFAAGVYNPRKSRVGPGESLHVAGEADPTFHATRACSAGSQLTEASTHIEQRGRQDVIHASLSSLSARQVRHSLARGRNCAGRSRVWRVGERRRSVGRRRGPGEHRSPR